jgi:hypothetical protein
LFVLFQTTIFSMLLALFFALSLRSLTEGAPIIPEGATPKDSGISCQQFRTLPSIVYSCLLTMFACTWTAVHPNLPDPDDSKRRVFGRRMKIVLVALLAPEYILFWALTQRKAAKELVKAAKAGEPSVIKLELSVKRYCSKSGARALDNCARLFPRHGWLRPRRFTRHPTSSSHTWET